MFDGWFAVQRVYQLHNAIYKLQTHDGQTSPTFPSRSHLLVIIILFLLHLPIRQINVQPHHTTEFSRNLDKRGMHSLAPLSFHPLSLSCLLFCF